jgi:hypothetical protein
MIHVFCQTSDCPMLFHLYDAMHRNYKDGIMLKMRHNH